MIAVGIDRNSKGSGNAVVPYLDLTLTNKGTNNCVPNIGSGLETGDVVTGWKDANTYWVAAIYNGGDPADRTNYTPLNEIVMDFVCPVPSTPPPSGGGGTPPSTGGATTLPLVYFYYEGFWETGDVVHEPEVNSWVDYLDQYGVQYRFIVGGLENGCQLIQASSIVDTNGCAPCNLPATVQTSYYKAGDYPEYSLNGQGLWGEVYYKDIDGNTQITALAPNEYVSGNIVEGPIVTITHYGIVQTINAIEIIY